ncbi:hypothetical protein V6N11_065642 [Hibiscus sabdariffa]|uniref:Uncharacterized protein n=1 Tax=Hibiscus sabdariffa TaxID=183260 RepID=A0ABR2PHX2_9ROSI
MYGSGTWQPWEIVLQHLYMGEMENLLTLPTWFQHLMSLQKLVIIDCPNLLSIQELEIKGCPKLRERSVEENGEDWPKIAHVPHIFNSSHDWYTSTSMMNRLDASGKSSRACGFRPQVTFSMLCYAL